MTELMVPPSVLYAKPAARSRDGLAASQSRDAAAAGARILAQGGHAVDAAVAVSLALGAVEPWMSGLGGGGFATLWDAKKREVRCLDYGMIAPQAIDPADYPLTGGPTAEGFFGWPGVLEDRNILGPHSVAVPGLVSGLSLAHRTYGRLPWGDLVQPAIALAERGLSLDWYGAMSLLVEAKGLDRFEATRSVYLPGGRVPQPFEEGVPAFLKLGRLIDTLKKLAAPDGPERFYRGDIAADLIRDLQAAGSKISLRRPRALPGALHRSGGDRLSRCQGLCAVRPDRRPDLEARADRVAGAPAGKAPRRRRRTMPSMPRRSTAPIATGSRTWAPATARRGRAAPATSASRTRTAMSSPGPRRCCRASARSCCRLRPAS